MVPHHVHQINIMSKAAALLICVLLGHMMSAASSLPASINAYLTEIPKTTMQVYKKKKKVSIYLVDKSESGNTKKKKTSVTSRAGSCRMMQL